MAGFDGYSHDNEENYISDDMSFVVRRALADVRNKDIEEALKILSRGCW